MTPEASTDSLNRAPSTTGRGFVKSNGFAAVAVVCLLTISAIAGAQGADCLISPPGATITCPAQPLPALQVFNVGVPAVINPTSSFTTQWTLLANTAGASIVGLPSCGSLPGGATCPVTVQVTQVGAVTVRADLVITTPTGQMVNKNCEVTLTVIDNGPPIITCPPDVNVECNTPTTPSVTGTATATDPCGSASVTFTDAITGQTCAGSIITRTWTATDGSGNTSTCAQIITTVDTTPPSITCPGPASVQCFSQVPPPNIQLVTASDNCGGLVTVTHAGDSASNGTSSCNNVITRTYLATDPCGNTNTCTQLITVNDTTPPSITCPGPASVQCFSGVPAPNTGSVTTSDNCGGLVTVTHAGDSASNGTSSCNNVITRTYVATDPCGNTNSCTQTITVNDTTPPSITCPGPASVQCFSGVPAPNTGSVTTSDNCGGLVTVTHAGDSASNGTSSCNNVITRTYVATDPCGNTNTCTQLITVNDTTAPSITCPGPVSVECFSGVPQADPGSVTTSDNCGGLVTVTHVGDSATNGTANCNVITRTYQATDPCGNTNTCTQTITVSDTVPPVITCPPNANVPCGSSTDPTATGFATATDNCDPNPAITWSDVQVGACNVQPLPNPTNTVITRTWTATDSCNNTATCVQIIISVGPPLTCLQPLVANLGGGCGGLGAPQLSMSLPMPGGFVSLHVGGATPNSQLILAAQLPPFATPDPITPPCVIGVDVYSPTTMVMDNLATDSAGEWIYGFLLVPFPELSGLNVRVQAGVVSQGGPLNFIQLSDTIEGTIGNCPPCTASLEDWGGFGPIGGVILAANYVTLFPGGLDVGQFNPGNGPVAPNGLHWTGDLAGLAALHQFLTNLPPPGSLNSVLFQDFVNPTSSTQVTVGAGSFARYMAVLKLNIAFSAAGLLGGTPIPQPGIGALIYVNPGNSLNGFSVLQILAAFNDVLAGLAAPPAGYNLTTMTALLEDLSLSFHACTPSIFAGTHLFFPNP